MYKAVLVVIAVIATGVAANAQKQGWASIGFSTKGEMLIETKRITSTTYPTGGAGNLVGVLTPKSYAEAWITLTDGTGSTIEQLLWVFDCKGRAGELAAVKTGDDPGSYDRTSSALTIGVERHMQRIPPNSLYELAEPIVCKR